LGRGYFLRASVFPEQLGELMHPIMIEKGRKRVGSISERFLPIWNLWGLEKIIKAKVPCESKAMRLGEYR